MKPSTLIYTILFAISIMACQNNSSTTADAGLAADIKIYNDSVMAIHDRTMPLMTNLENLRKDLIEKRKTYIGSNNYDEVTKVNNLLGELNKSENAMWSWMYNFKPDSLQNEDKLNYLINELREVRKMENIVVSGIAKAESYIQK